MKTRLRQIIGSLRILGRRARELGQPGLQAWTFAGEQAAQDVGAAVGALAHKNEVTELDWSARLKAMLADNKIDSVEVAELQRAPDALTRCAERSHDIGETVQ